jgi:Glutathione peroxidase
MKSFVLALFFSLVSISMIQEDKSLHSFKVNDIDGKEFDFSSLRGKKVLVVNVASKCGFTPQYEKLQQLYEKYKDKNFVVVGFPANNFNEQEPGTDEEIKTFCMLNYNVSFPMMSKIDVVGKNKTSIYKWLTEMSENRTMDAEVQWNFQKFMIDPNGQLVDFVASREDPFCDKIVKWIEG